jgi:hypothetical protein
MLLAQRHDASVEQPAKYGRSLRATVQPYGLNRTTLALDLQRMAEAPVSFGPMRVNEQYIHRRLLSLAVIHSIRTFEGNNGSEGQRRQVIVDSS